MPYIVSTMANSVSYNTYNFIGDPKSKQGVLPVVKDKIVIHGGAGMPSLRSGFGEMTKDQDGVPMWTAEGVVTSVTDAQLAVLQDHWLFKKHQDSGHVRVLTKDVTGNHKAVVKEVASMESDERFGLLKKGDKRIAASQVKVKTISQETGLDIQ